LETVKESKAHDDENLADTILGRIRRKLPALRPELGLPSPRTPPELAQLFQIRIGSVKKEVWSLSADIMQNNSLRYFQLTHKQVHHLPL
jgi:hypothetical protein